MNPTARTALKVIPLVLAAALIVLAVRSYATAEVPTPTSKPAAMPSHSASAEPSATPAARPSRSPSAKPSPTPAPTSAPTPAAPSPSPTPRPTPAHDARAAAGLSLVRFVEQGGPVSQVFVVEPDGAMRQVTGLASGSVGASLPVWSPDGTGLAFGPPKTGAGPNPVLSVVNADGSGERVIGVLGDEFGVPHRWSPDGQSLLWSDLDAVDGAAMWLADVATGEVTHLGEGQIPRWLPDGRSFSFHRGVEGRNPSNPAALTEVIYTMSLESGEVRELATASDVIWSPDGSAMLLQYGTDRVVLADADGSNPRDLVRGSSPVWSPDGTQIVFTYDHNHDGLPILAAVDRDGDELWSGVVGSSPTWSPDGSRLAVEILYPELMVEVLDAATGEVLWETAGTQPAWRP